MTIGYQRQQVDNLSLCIGSAVGVIVGVVIGLFINELKLSVTLGLIAGALMGYSLEGRSGWRHRGKSC